MVEPRGLPGGDVAENSLSALGLLCLLASPQKSAERAQCPAPSRGLISTCW